MNKFGLNGGESGNETTCMEYVTKFMTQQFVCAMAECVSLHS